MYTYTHTHTRKSAARVASRQKSTANVYTYNIHQLFRIQYTCFKLYAVNVYWWICIYFCCVDKSRLPGDQRLLRGDRGGQMIIIVMVIVLHIVVIIIIINNIISIIYIYIYTLMCVYIYIYV